MIENSVLFLDIDGVLNTQSMIDKLVISEPGESIEDKVKWICPDVIPILNRYIDETNSVIVISSGWRKYVSVEDLSEIFRKVGIKAPVIGVTKVIEGGSRLDEISDWVKENNLPFYMCFDDIFFKNLPFQNFHSINIDPAVGLTYKDVEQAIEIHNDFRYRRDWYYESQWIKSAEYDSDYKITVAFANNNTLTVDLCHLMDNPRYESIKNTEDFKKFKVYKNNIIWSDKYLRVSSMFLYAIGCGLAEPERYILNCMDVECIFHIDSVIHASVKNQLMVTDENKRSDRIGT